MMSEVGKFSKSIISNLPMDIECKTYKIYHKTISHYENQAIYIYSFKENRMLYASGWKELLGYEDGAISMLKLVDITVPRFADFTNEINDKALMFLNSINKNLTDYHFTLELEKVHQNRSHVPLLWRVAVFKSEAGKITEILGEAQKIMSLRLGKILQYSAHGPEKSKFEETLSKELFHHLAISKKEKEALTYAANGFTFKEIAHQLGVSQSAIEKRIIPLYKKFNVKSLTHLVSFAYQNNLLA